MYDLYTNFWMHTIHTKYCRSIWCTLCKSKIHYITLLEILKIYYVLMYIQGWQIFGRGATLSYNILGMAKYEFTHLYLKMHDGKMNYSRFWFSKNSLRMQWSHYATVTVLMAHIQAICKVFIILSFLQANQHQQPCSKH